MVIVFFYEAEKTLTCTYLVNCEHKKCALCAIYTSTVYTLRHIFAIDSSVVSGLHSVVEPFLLRRVKSEVMEDLPVKSEVALYTGLSAMQKNYYKAILTKDLSRFTSLHSTLLFIKATCSAAHKPNSILVYV